MEDTSSNFLFFKFNLYANLSTDYLCIIGNPIKVHVDQSRIFLDIANLTPYCKAFLDACTQLEDAVTDFGDAEELRRQPIFGEYQRCAFDILREIITKREK